MRTDFDHLQQSKACLLGFEEFRSEQGMKAKEE
jgi:hypothetical protein